MGADAGVDVGADAGADMRADARELSLFQTDACDLSEPMRALVHPLS